MKIILSIQTVTKKEIDIIHVFHQDMKILFDMLIKNRKNQ